LRPCCRSFDSRLEGHAATLPLFKGCGTIGLHTGHVQSQLSHERVSHVLWQSIPDHALAKFTLISQQSLVLWVTEGA
jgi:hypothetical protein